MQQVQLKHSRTHPKYLNSNSTSHKWAFGAIAELVDNAVDAKAKTFDISTGLVNNEEDKRYLSCQDDGIGMSPVEVHRMMSFGHCSKIETDGQVPIGMYGNGFKSGSMRLGDDVLVFTKHKHTRTIGFLSQTFLKDTNAQEVIVPMATWNLGWKLFDNLDIGVDSKLSLESLKVIQGYSFFTTDDDIVDEFDKIKSDSGTRIVIMNLKKNRNTYEFNFDDPKDIQLREERETATPVKKKRRTNDGSDLSAIPPDEYSLRAYFRILYMNPRMKMYIRGYKVYAKRIIHSLYFTKEIKYRPNFRDESNMKVETRVVFGFTKEHKEHYGLMYYHKNRLISRYNRIGIMNTHGSRGVGVVGIIDCYFLTPTHNKQDFVYGDKYRILVDSLKDKLRKYWLSCNIDANTGGDGIRKFWEDLEKVKGQGPFWIQCDNCLAWRRVPKPESSFPPNWVCSNNTDKKYNRCKIPEEPDTGFTVIKVKRTGKKGNYDLETSEDEADTKNKDDKKEKEVKKPKTPKSTKRKSKKNEEVSSESDYSPPASPLVSPEIEESSEEGKRNKGKKRKNSTTDKEKVSKRKRTEVNYSSTIDALSDDEVLPKSKRTKSKSFISDSESDLDYLEKPKDKPKKEKNGEKTKDKKKEKKEKEKEIEKPKKKEKEKRKKKEKESEIEKSTNSNEKDNQRAKENEKAHENEVEQEKEKEKEKDKHKESQDERGTEKEKSNNDTKTNPPRVLSEPKPLPKASENGATKEADISKPISSSIIDNFIDVDIEDDLEIFISRESTNKNVEKAFESSTNKPKSREILVNRSKDDVLDLPKAEVKPTDPKTPSPSERQLTHILEQLCGKVSQKFNIPSQRPWNEFEVKDWMSFDVDAFLGSLILDK